MVKLPPLLTSERVNLIKRARSQKFVFDQLTHLLVKGQSEVSSHIIFDALIMREKLGSTCIGNGISIPRAHVNITNPRAAVLILKKGLSLNSIDKEPITIFFSLLIPSKNHNSFLPLITELNRQLIMERHIEFFNKITSPELIAKHFETLLEQIINNLDIQKLES